MQDEKETFSPLYLKSYPTQNGHLIIVKSLSRITFTFEVIKCYDDSKNKSFLIFVHFSLSAC